MDKKELMEAISKSGEELKREIRKFTIRHFLLMSGMNGLQFGIQGILLGLYWGSGWVFVPTCFMVWAVKMQVDETLMFLADWRKLK